MKNLKISALPLTWVFGLTIFVSAFLLFQIQPMISKIILPWFGGGTAVWTAAMFFFQVLLLGGYAYAHFLSRLSIRKQSWAHIAILGLVFFWLLLMMVKRGIPILPEDSLKPSSGGFPAWQVLTVLAASVGIPYLLLSTTSSLAQSWFSRIEQRTSPYSFYILSNAASLLALLSYPIVVEPVLSSKDQSIVWTTGFGIYLFLIAVCAVILLKSPNTAGEGPNEIVHRPVVSADVITEEIRMEKPSILRLVGWIGLSTCSSVLLLAVTNLITQDIASIPFLWVLPLSLYLASIIIAFDDRLVRLLDIFTLVCLATLVLGYLTITRPNDFSILQLIAANCIMLLAACLLCHGTLYSQRPHPQYLTSFYLMLSIGGALGGVLVSLVAPALFPDFWEYQLALGGCTVVAVILSFSRRQSWLHKLRFPIGLLALGMLFFLYQSAQYWFPESLETYRNFYGVLRVRTMDYQGQKVYNLVNGRIIHGSQAADPAYRSRPTRYYSPNTGIGLAFTSNLRRQENQPLRAGMVGLGAGTVAAYGQPGDVIRFYEINPEVVNIARDTQYFNYLRDSRATIEIVMGDARLSMERESHDPKFPKYDLLAIDAFSGDSIPTHLIDKEAVALFLLLLKEDGVLAVHISNRYLDLEPVVARLADEYELSSARITGGSSDWLGTNATWILLSRSPIPLGTPEIAAVKQTVERKSGLRLWTDDYSNLFQVLR